MPKIRKILKISFRVFALTSLVGAAYNWRNIHMVATYNPVLIPPLYGAPDNATEARLQDLRYLRKLPSIDRSFTDEEQAQFVQVVDGLEARVETLSDADLYLGVSKAVALADNGHTNVSDQPLYKRFNTIGAKLYWFSDGLYIVRANAKNADIVGSRIVSINGQSIDVVTKTLSQYRGGAQSWRKLAMPRMIESPQIMHAAGLASSPDEINFTIEGEDGTERNVILQGHSLEGGETLPFRRAWSTILSEPMPGEDDNWVRTLQTDNAPLSLRGTDSPIFTSLEGNGHYIRTKTGFGTKELPIPAFFENALAGIDDGSLDYLVADYRLNSGGDYLKSIDFAKHAPGKLKEDGKLYLVTGPNTFSAAIVTIAMLKHYSNDKVVIVGAPMGDREQFWAERGMSFKLPNSGTYVNYATGFHDWNQGCGEHKYCYTFNRIHGVAAGSLVPTVTIEPSYADYSKGRDPVMDWVISNHTNSVQVSGISNH